MAWYCEDCRGEHGSETNPCICCAGAWGDAYAAWSRMKVYGSYDVPQEGDGKEYWPRIPALGGWLVGRDHISDSRPRGHFG